MNANLEQLMQSLHLNVVEPLGNMDTDDIRHRPWFPLWKQVADRVSAVTTDTLTAKTEPDYWGLFQMIALAEALREMAQAAPDFGAGEEEGREAFFQWLTIAAWQSKYCHTHPLTAACGELRPAVTENGIAAACEDGSYAQLWERLPDPVHAFRRSIEEQLGCR